MKNIMSKNIPNKPNILKKSNSKKSVTESHPLDQQQ